MTFPVTTGEQIEPGDISTDTCEVTPHDFDLEPVEPRTAAQWETHLPCLENVRGALTRSGWQIDSVAEVTMVRRVPRVPRVPRSARHGCPRA